MSLYFDELVKRSLKENDDDAQINLYFKLHYDLRREKEACMLCNKYKSKIPLFQAMLDYRDYKLQDAYDRFIEICKSNTETSAKPFALKYVRNFSWLRSICTRRYH